MMTREVKVSTRTGKFQQTIQIGPHTIVGDEPVDSGGEDAGPAPHELLAAALATCTSMTVKMYADRKGWPLERVTVEVAQEKVEDVRLFRRAIKLEGALDDEQRGKLLEIAGKCPVHKTLVGEIRIDSALV
jgi:putative redox protein